MVRCLIVDDSPVFLAAAGELLRHQGITVVGVAADSREALRQAERVRPDVALVDLDLGSESGLELTERLHLRSVPAILISTHSEQDYRELITTSRAIGFLSKASLSGPAVAHLLAAATGRPEK
ncbi:response regulator [Streptomyces yaizuensis]|uniref:Response regulator transcription factor n=1 Tax=Streptomyces yaizuensis TaxID=2989713 RepID=A0ABQ5P8C0_9ACTN|nr:response regulator transcription factor [Streptomyces sp. YSPA8]GLF98815.1 response regulator transcription factor [Streptomyces sp. YSPA8]